VTLRSPWRLPAAFNEEGRIAPTDNRGPEFLLDWLVTDDDLVRKARAPFPDEPVSSLLVAVPPRPATARLGADGRFAEDTLRPAALRIDPFLALGAILVHAVRSLGHPQALR